MGFTMAILIANLSFNQNIIIAERLIVSLFKNKLI
ncbi:hypothetical protein [Legionella tucsonensis]